MARLPVQGSDNGIWGTVLNDYLLQAHDSGGLLKADSVGSSQLQDDAVSASHIADNSLPQAKIQNLNSDLSGKINTSARGAASGVASLDSSTKVPIAELPTGTGASQIALGNHTHPWQGYYPPEANGFVALSDPITTFPVGSVFSSGTFWLVRIYVPANQPIGRVAVAIRTAGTFNGTADQNKVVIYDDSGAKIGESADNSNLWAAAGWGNLPLTSVIAAQSTPRFVYAGVICNGWDNTTIQYNDIGATEVLNGGMGSVKRRSILASGTTAVPASIDPATYGTALSFMPLIGLAAA